MAKSLSLLLLALLAFDARAEPERNPFVVRAEPAPMVTRLIIGMKSNSFVRAQSVASADHASAAAAGRVASLGARTGTPLTLSHSIAADVHVATLAYPQQGALLTHTLELLRADADVAYVALDRRKRAHKVPLDPLYKSVPGLGQVGQTGQWYLQAPQVSAAGGTMTTAAINAEAAWDTTAGSASVVIAVLDTGILYGHPDLLAVASGGRLLPGYDFVGPDQPVANPPTYRTANESHGWDPDPSDPGDWVTLADEATTYFSGCLADPTVAEPSSWHGTRVAGVLGAITNNGSGIAGATWASQILPVRVLGKCGGFDSDIIAAMRWAAGLSVPGVPDNPNPAKIMNLSLGSKTQCSAAAGSPYPPVITELLAQGVTIFASAGNEGGPEDEPANCEGVIGVTAVRHVGSKSLFGNVSGTMITGALPGVVAIAAPGGNCYTSTGPCLFTLDTTTDAGAMGPDTSATGYIYTDQTNFNIGTSFSAPLVAAIGALMLSVNSHLGPPQIAVRLAHSARPFPVLPFDASGVAMRMCALATTESDVSQMIECNCTTTTCGAGLADAPGAIAEALRPIAVITTSGTNANGNTVTLAASTSAAADGHTLSSYAWAVTEHTSAALPTLGTQSGTSSSLAIASCGDVTVQLTVTDDAGRTDSASQVYGAAPASGMSCMAPSSGSSSGGGSLDAATLALIATLAGLALGSRRRTPPR